jgi:HAMP domain-containing protein
LSQPSEGAFRTVLLVIAIGLASFIGTRLGSATDTPDRVATDTPTDELSRCAGALDRIAERLEALRPATALAEPPKTSPSISSGPSRMADELASLEAALGRLTSTVKSIEDVASMTRTHATDLKIPDSPPDPGALDVLNKIDEEKRTAPHLFWSYQRVLDTFGRPDLVRAVEAGGVRWYYGEAGDQRSFWFVDGVVAQVH